jgi:hypothetical protein
MSNTDLKGSRMVSSACFLWDTRLVTRIAKFDKRLVSDRGKKKIYIKEKGSIAIWDMDISLLFETWTFRYSCRRRNMFVIESRHWNLNAKLISDVYSLISVHAFLIAYVILKFKSCRAIEISCRVIYTFEVKGVNYMLSVFFNQTDVCNTEIFIFQSNDLRVHVTVFA